MTKHECVVCHTFTFYLLREPKERMNSAGLRWIRKIIAVSHNSRLMKATAKWEARGAPWTTCQLSLLDNNPQQISAVCNLFHILAIKAVNSRHQYTTNGETTPTYTRSPENRKDLILFEGAAKCANFCYWAGPVSWTSSPD